MNELDIFSAAVELKTPADRDRFLDRVCGDNPALRQRIASLLHSYNKAGSFIETPAHDFGVSITVDRQIAEGPGAVIGPYKLLQQIGEGGMGVVFMAEQTEPFERTVALKIIKPGMDTRQIIARFEAERQAVAMMDHPNIAKVLDAGTTDSGRPYFVMELVKGIPITKYCDDRHLPIRDRLALFIEVCLAVQHAHQKGIIHRDIKPTNVLVAEYDHQAVPKVIDFGVAKATAQKLTARTVFTEFGQVLGTVEYMSPEQAKLNQLDVDTRSDVYSLGVLLYELLAGSTPFEGKRLRDAAFDEMLRIIREEEPPKPSTRLTESKNLLASISTQRHIEPAKLTRLMRGELDWIVMKAIEKERSRRFATASGMARDIKRFLEGEAVEACPPSALYRMKKFVRRHKGSVLTALLVLFTLIGGIAGTSFGLVRANRARQAEVERAEGERQAKLESQAREAEMKAVLDFVRRKIFAAARPVGLDGGLGYDVTLRQAINAALPFVKTGFTNQPLIEARLRMTLGASFYYLGDQNAAEQFEMARELFTHVLGPDHPDTLVSMHNLAECYGALGRYEESLKLYDETLALGKDRSAFDHPEMLTSTFNLATAHAVLGRHAESLELFEENYFRRNARLGIDHSDTLASMDNLADMYAAVGRHADALKMREDLLALRSAKLGPDHPDAIASMNRCAWALATSPFNELRKGKRALEFAEKVCEATEYKVPRYLDTLAAAYAETGDFELAVKWSEKSLEMLNDQDESNFREHFSHALANYKEKKPFRQKLSVITLRSGSDQQWIQDQPTAQSPSEAPRDATSGLR